MRTTASVSLLSWVSDARPRLVPGEEFMTGGEAEVAPDSGAMLVVRGLAPEGFCVRACPTRG